jgi:hypothetical protein
MLHRYKWMQNALEKRKNTAQKEKEKWGVPIPFPFRR